MTTTTLDDKTVRDMTEHGIHFDTELKGFGVRVRPGSGGRLLKTWVIQYRFGGQQRRLKLGDVAKLRAKQAREIARDKLADVIKKIDPAAEKKKERDEDSTKLRSVIERYLEKEKQTWAPVTYGIKALYLLEGDYFKPLHGKPINAITRADVAARISDIRDDHSDNTAKQARSHFRAFFTWAMEEQLTDADANVVIGTKEPEGNDPRERVLKPHELAAIWNACEGAGDYGKIVRLLMLTGCRRNEIGKLRWSWFNPDLTAFTIPGEHAKNGREHHVPVTGLMRDIITSVERMVDRDPLFGVRERSDGFKDWGGKGKLGDGLNDWQLRDLRRTFRTGLGKLKVEPHIAELCINHSQHGLIAVYDKHRYEDEIAEAFTRWSNHIATIISDGKVVALHSQTA